MFFIVILAAIAIFVFLTVSNNLNDRFYRTIHQRFGIVGKGAGIKPAVEWGVPTSSTTGEEKVRRIPRAIHMCGNTTLLTPAIRQNVYRLRDANPDFEFRYFDDAQMDTFITEKMPPIVATAYSRLNHPVMKADLFRYCVIYTNGGVYLDLKSSSKEPLSKLLEDPRYSEVGCFLGTWGGFSEVAPSIITPIMPNSHRRILPTGGRGEYVQWFLAAESHHPVMKAAIEQVVHNVLYFFPNVYRLAKTNPKDYDALVKQNFYGKNGILVCTGPIAFTNGVLKAVSDISGGSKIHDFGGYVSSLHQTNADFPFVYNSAYPNDKTKHRKDNPNHYTSFTQKVIIDDNSEVFLFSPKNNNNNATINETSSDDDEDVADSKKKLSPRRRVLLSATTTPRVDIPQLAKRAFFPRPGFKNPPIDRGNNCLFIAVITSGCIRDPVTNSIANPQALREICDEILKDEGLPLFKPGTPAGEQYLPALSKVLHRQISVFRGGKFVATISHEDVTKDLEEVKKKRNGRISIIPLIPPPICIEHQGSPDGGHWVPAAAAAATKTGG